MAQLAARLWNLKFEAAQPWRCQVCLPLQALSVHRYQKEKSYGDGILCSV